MDFAPPRWDAPLDVDAAFRAVPHGATIKGMFPLALVQEAKRRGIALKAGRDRYLAFADYPLVEHMEVLVEGARAFFPDVTLRQALRKVGRGAPAAFLETTVGKVVLGTAEGIHELFRAMEKAFSITLSPGSFTVTRLEESEAFATLEGVYYFLDSHHVGIMEGMIRAAGFRPDVQVRPIATGAAEMRCRWEASSGPMSA